MPSCVYLLQPTGAIKNTPTADSIRARYQKQSPVTTCPRLTCVEILLALAYCNCDCSRSRQFAQPGNTVGVTYNPFFDLSSLGNRAEVFCFVLEYDRELQCISMQLRESQSSILRPISIRSTYHGSSLSHFCIPAKDAWRRCSHFQITRSSLIHFVLHHVSSSESTVLSQLCREKSMHKTTFCIFWSDCSEMNTVI